MVDSLSKNLENIVNYTGNMAPHIILDAIVGMHRTNQQAFWKNMAYVMNMYSELPKERYFDLRNEASREWCRAASESVGDIYLPFI